MTKKPLPHPDSHRPSQCVSLLCDEVLSGRILDFQVHQPRPDFTEKDYDWEDVMRDWITDRINTVTKLFK
jgi:hypothetical protein